MRLKSVSTAQRLSLISSSKLRSLKITSTLGRSTSQCKIVTFIFTNLRNPSWWSTYLFTYLLTYLPGFPSTPRMSAPAPRQGLSNLVWANAMSTNSSLPFAVVKVKGPFRLGAWKCHDNFETWIQAWCGRTPFLPHSWIFRWMHLQDVWCVCFVGVLLHDSRMRHVLFFVFMPWVKIIPKKSRYEWFATKSPHQYLRFQPSSFTVSARKEWPTHHSSVPKSSGNTSGCGKMFL